MTFAWQGFSLQHPEDWSPVTLSGDRKAGYVRIASPGRLALQVRWAQGKNDQPRKTLGEYLDRLAADAKKQKGDFCRDVEEVDGRIVYTYRGAYQGRGSVLTSGNRTFFLEVIGGRGDSLLATFRNAVAQFSAQENREREHWSLFGLSVHLPSGLRLERKLLHAGRTRLELAGPVKVSVERWAFAEQLLAKHGMEAWSRAVLKAPRAVATEEEAGIRLIHPASLFGRRESLVAHQPEQNQLVILDARFRNEERRPTWDWLT